MKCSSRHRFLTLRNLLSHCTARFFLESRMKFVYIRRGKHLQSHIQESEPNRLDSDTDGKDLEIPTLKGIKLQRVWFSTNGLFAFGWFSSPGNLHYVKVWDVVETTRNGDLRLQIVSSSSSKLVLFLTIK